MSINSVKGSHIVKSTWSNTLPAFRQGPLFSAAGPPSLCSISLEGSIKFSYNLVLPRGVREMRYMTPLRLFEDLTKARALGKGRLLGLDLGDKYVGLAVSDPENKIALPLSVLIRKKSNIASMASDFEKLVSHFSLVGFVGGSLYDRYGSIETDHTVQGKAFMYRLSRTGKLEGMRYTFWDESLTSKDIEFLLKPCPLHPVEYKTIMDKFAAVNILQGYLDYINRLKLKPDECSTKAKVQHE